MEQPYKQLLPAIFLIMICYSAGVAVQVDGYCFLENQTNHEGTRVLFEADSPTAVTDSVYSDISGFYQIDLEPGIYDVNFSHAGYNDENLPDRLLLDPQTLPQVTLLGIQYQLLEGEISGVLSSGIYLAVGHIQVDNEDSLYIEPGTEILFNGPYHFSIYGYLYAVGTEEDSIIFCLNEGIELWYGFTFWTPSHDCVMKFCSISGSNLGGFSFHGFNCLLENCLITRNYGSVAGGISFGYFCNSRFKDCTFINNSSSNAGAISCADESHPQLEDCLVTENTSTGMVGAFRFRENSAPVVSNCQIVNNGQFGGILCDENSQPVFQNCTISQNWDYGDLGYGIRIQDDAEVTVVNCVFTNNSTNGIQYYGNNPGSVTFSDFYHNGSGNFGGTSIPPFIGEIVTTNYKNDPCDTYYNIFLDPLFADPLNGNFNLTAGSPCIDAGDPDSPFDPDSTIADLGAFYYDQGITVPAVDDLTIIILGGDIILQWSEVPGAQYYKIYRSDQPYFDISSMSAIGLVFSPIYGDTGAVAGGSWFYVVTVED